RHSPHHERSPTALRESTRLAGRHRCGPRNRGAGWTGRGGRWRRATNRFVRPRERRRPAKPGPPAQFCAQCTSFQFACPTSSTVYTPAVLTATHESGYRANSLETLGQRVGEPRRRAGSRWVGWVGGASSAKELRDDRLGGDKHLVDF